MKDKKQQNTDQNNDHSKCEKDCSVFVISGLPPVNGKTKQRKRKPAEHTELVVAEVLLFFVKWAAFVIHYVV